MLRLHDIMALRHQRAGLFNWPGCRKQNNVFAILTKSLALDRVDGNVPALVSQPAASAIQSGVFCMSTSKLQEETKERLRILLNKYEFVENFRPDWMRNPETGYLLELDFWLPDLKAGIEVQGRQHFEFVPHFHSTQEEFEKQLQRDEVKKQVCRDMGVFFFEVSCLQDIDSFIEASKDHCAEMAHELYYKATAMKTLSFYAAEIFRDGTSRNKNPERVAKLTTRIMHIAEKHKVPLESIRPDFSLTKLDMAFPGKPKAKVILRTQEGNPVKQQDAVIINWKDRIGLVRWFNDAWGEQYHDMHFNLDTGEPQEEVLDKHNHRWTLDPNSVPDKLGHFLDD